MNRLVPLFFVLCAPFSAPAQDATTPQAPALNSSISGIVTDKGTGKPLRNYIVSTDVRLPGKNPAQGGNNTREVKSTTDESGRYKLSDLPPGEYRVEALEAQQFGREISKRVSLAGHDLENFNFQVIVDATISGKVLDENKEPVPGMMVHLVSKEYFLGSIGYFLKSAGRTDDRGEYKIARVEPGHPYLVLAEKRDLKLPAHSQVPLNPKLRRRVPMRTWYPDSPDKEGAAPITLAPGENRANVDIEVRKSQSYCIEGVLSAPSGPGALNFTIEAQQPSSGISSGSGMYMAAPGGITGADGKFRICDLYPGSYRVLSMQRLAGQPPPSYSAATIAIGDRDLTNLQITATAGIDLEGEVVLEGPMPAQPITTRAAVSLQPLLRVSMFGENNGGRYDIPGTFSIKPLLLDDYLVRASLNAPGLYVKDVTYAGRSVMYEPLRLGSAIGNGGLRVTIAQDGAKLNLRVADKDGNAAADMHVVMMPAEVASPGMLAATLVSGQTDQAGKYVSRTLPPGKYYVAATEESFDATEGSIDNLWRSRNRFTEVTLPPGGEAQIAVEPIR